MHFSAPSHPLIHAFVLRREEFQGVERLIVETQEQGEKLLATLQALAEIEKNTKQYRVIMTKTDILEVMYDENLVGIFPIETLDWEVGDESDLTLLVQKNMQYSEEQLVNWLTDHGFTAKKSGEEHSFFRQGDTVSVETSRGTLLVNFFGNTLETIYLDGIEQEEWRFFAR